MMIHFVLPLFALSFAPAGLDPQQPAAPLPAAHGKTSDETTIDASLWFISFDPKVPPGKLPIDARTAAAEMGERYPHRKGADGRIPTWGLASQLQTKELEIIDGPHRLICRDGQLLTQSEKDRSPGAGPPPWQIIASPRIRVALNQQGMVSVGRPIHYMTRHDDGCLRVESSSDLVEGVELRLTASRILPEGIRFTGVSLKFTRVTARQPIDGVPFEVGRPILDTRETSLDLTLDNGNLAVIPLPQAENEPAVLVFLTARVVEGTK
jgi:hypothetical protein